MNFRDIPHLGLWSTDFLTGETTWSNEMFVIYGLKPGSLTPSVEMLMKFTHPDDLDGVTNGIHEATKTLKPSSFYYRIVRKDKAVRELFSAVAIGIDANGKPIDRYGVCLNLTGLAGEKKEKVRKKLNGFELPSPATLFALDPLNIQVALLREIASIVSKQQDLRISKTNLGE